MNSRGLVFFFAMVLTTQVIAFADYELAKEMIFTVEKNGGIKLVTKETRLFLEGKVPQIISISAPFYAPISRIRATAENGGVVKNLRQKAISFYYLQDIPDIFIAEAKIYQIDFSPHLKKGSRAAFAYSQHFSDLAFLPIVTIPAARHIDRFEIVFNHGKEVDVNFDLFFPQEKPTYDLHREERRTTLVFKNLGRRDSLANFPFGPIPGYIRIRLKEGTRDLTKSEEATFNEWYSGLLEEVPVNLDPALPQGLTAGRETPLAKLAAIYDYVRSEISYLAEEANLGGFVPRSPNLVLTRKYGDCKDKALLMKALARAVGLDVRLALVSLDYEPEFDGVHVAFFNHVICAYRSEAGWSFFDPTGKYFMPGQIPESEQGKSAFILGNGPDYWVEIQRPPPSPKLDIIVEADLEQPGNASASLILRGNYAAWAAKLHEKGALGDLERINTMFRGPVFDKFQWKDPHEPAIHIGAQVDLSQFFITSSQTGNHYIPLTPFTMNARNLLKRETDPYAVYFNHSLDLRLVLRIKHPPTLGKLEEMTLDHSPGLAYSALFQPGRTESQIQYSLRRHHGIYDGPEKEQLLAFLRSYSQSQKSIFTLKPEDQPQ